jgi:hypothetical protein
VVKRLVEIAAESRERKPDYAVRRYLEGAGEAPLRFYVQHHKSIFHH